jgi:hypothetical protein
VGPNHLQQYPNLTSVTSDTDQLTVTGYVLGIPGKEVLLEFYVTAPGTTDLVPIGSMSVTPNDQGVANFTFYGPAQSAGAVVRATATDDTSEFSPGMVVAGSGSNAGNDLAFVFRQAFAPIGSAAQSRGDLAFASFFGNESLLGGVNRSPSYLSSNLEGSDEIEAGVNDEGLPGRETVGLEGHHRERWEMVGETIFADLAAPLAADEFGPLTEEGEGAEDADAVAVTEAVGQDQNVPAEEINSPTSPSR